MWVSYRPSSGSPEADQGVAQRDARQGRVARELEYAAEERKPDFRTDRADRAVAVEGFRRGSAGVSSVTSVSLFSSSR